MIENFLKLDRVLNQLFGYGIFALLGVLSRVIWKMYKELKAKNDQLDVLLAGQNELDSRLDSLETQGNLRQEASLASLHDRIYSNYEVILKRGSVTLKELNNIGHLWKAYSSLGGNGTGQKMYERICELPVIEEEKE
ncbi:hypothetical protein [Enterococcus xiangfangensis]|uniref:hypothetical protein n=1 Tax=Enterococcus xiangfangensis TaxID=1296537 RepID=UPI003D182515